MPPPVPGSAELSHSILTSLGFSFFLLGPLGSSRGGSCQKEFPPNPGQGGSRQYKSFGSSLKHAEIGPESFGIVVCRLVGIVQDILGWVWPSFRSKSGSKSLISGRICVFVGVSCAQQLYCTIASYRRATLSTGNPPQAL